MTEETEINPMRVMMVTSIIQRNQGEAFTVENLTRFFPADFDLGEDDLAHYRAAHPIDVPPEPPIEFEGDTAPTAEAPAPAVESAKPEPEPAQPPPPEAIEAAVTRRNKAEQDLANARVLQITEDNQERALRGDLAKAVSAFQSGFPPITREQLMRDVIASEQERKAAGHPSRPQSGPGKSVVDRVAFYGRGGNPARGDYRRGAFSSQAKGAPNYDPRRGAVAKAPSER
jgi:hypothetical protein